MFGFKCIFIVNLCATAKYVVLNVTLNFKYVLKMHALIEGFQ